MSAFEFFSTLSEEYPFWSVVLLAASAVALIGWAFAPWLIRGAIVDGFEKIRKTMREKGAE